MLTTTLQDVNATMTHGGDLVTTAPNELLDRYYAIVNEKRLNWTSHLRLKKRLGAGGQG